jgi:flagellar hook assembly protein FlgD
VLRAPKQRLPSTRVVLRRLLVIAAVFSSLLVVSSADAQTSGRVLLMPGVTYDRDVQFTLHGPVVLHVVLAPRPDSSLYRLAPVLSNGAVVATDTLTGMERALSSQGTPVGVNGDYFNANPGDPKGILIQDGALISPPPATRSSLGLTGDGTIQVSRVAFAGIWRGTGQRRPMALNEPPSGGSVTLYTSAWGPTTPPEAGPVTADVIPSLPSTRPNTDLTGTVSQVVGNGEVPIPPGGAVLVARGSQAPVLAREAPQGTPLFLRLSLTPDWSGMPSAIGGGPVIVQNGKPIFRANEDLGAALLNRRTPRSAVGQLADGRIVFVTVDGGGGGYSVGMTNFELALAMIRLGAVQAMALGSGPAATMAFDAQALSRPAAPSEPQLSDALVLVYGGVYVPALTSTVVSPNGDGVDDTIAFSYRLVRPSTVSAVVIGRGVREVLDTGAQPAGTRTFTFAGLGTGGAPLLEGSYRFSVTATDDLGRSSSADRVFSVNNTLAQLAVAPATAFVTPTGRRALTVTFTLARPASIRALIETHSGIVVRTLFAGDLEVGPQQLVWDGRDSRRNLGRGGAYLVRVRATNAIGDVELTQPFTVRR